MRNVITAVLLLLLVTGCGSDEPDDAVSSAPAVEHDAADSPPGLPDGSSSFGDVLFDSTDHSVSSVNIAGGAAERDWGLINDGSLDGKIGDPIAVPGWTREDDEEPEDTGRHTIFGISNVLLVQMEAFIASSTVAAVSPDGSQLMMAADDGVPELHDLKTLTSRTLEGHAGEILATTFSSDGSLLITGGGVTDGGQQAMELFVWDTATGTRKWQFGESERLPVRDAALIPGTSRLGSVNSSRLAVWDLATGSLVNSVDDVFDFSGGNTLVVSSQHIAVHSGDGRVAIFEADSLDRTASRKLASEDINGLEYSPDGTMLAVFAEDAASVSLWDATGESRLQILTGHVSELNDMAFSPDGTMLADIASGSVKVWNIQNGQPLAWYFTWGDVLQFVNDGSQLMTFGGQARFWPFNEVLQKKAVDPESPPLLNFPHVELEYSGNAISRDGSITVDTDLTDNGGVSSTRSGEVLTVLENSEELQSVAISPDASLVAMKDHYSGELDSSEPVIVWDSSTGTVKWKSRALKNVGKLAFMPDGQRVAVTCDAGLAIVGPDSVEVLTSEPVVELVLAGNRLVTFSHIGNGLIIWSFDGRQPTSVRCEGSSVLGMYATKLSASPDAKYLAKGGSRNGDPAGSTIIIWDAATGREVRRFSFPTELYGMQLLRDRTVVAVNLGESFDNETIFLDFHSGEIVGRMFYELTPHGITGDGELLLCGEKIVRVGAVLDHGHLRACDHLEAAGARVSYENGHLNFTLTRLVQEEDIKRLADIESPLAVHFLEPSLITEDGFEQTMKLPQLRGVEVDNSSSIKPEWLQHLTHATSLESLRLPDDSDETAVSVVGSMPDLRQLDTGLTLMQDAGFRHFAKLTKLRQFNVATGHTTNPDLAFLAANPHLELLHLQIKATDEQMSDLAGLRELRHIIIPDGVTDAGLAMVSS